MDRRLDKTKRNENRTKPSGKHVRRNKKQNTQNTKIKSLKDITECLQTASETIRQSRTIELQIIIVTIKNLHFFLRTFNHLLTKLYRPIH